MQRLTFGYKAPPQSQTPLILQVFNPTFWVMVEMTMGAWAANLPVLTPLARDLTKRYKTSSLYKTLSSSSLYKTLTSSGNSISGSRSRTTEADEAVKESNSYHDSSRQGSSHHGNHY